MKIRALVVDESPFTRCVVMQALRATGLRDFEFVEAASGADAVRLARKSAPDVVFADWCMPHVSGAKLFEALRSAASKPDLPVILVAADDRPECQPEQLADEMDAAMFLTGPICVDRWRAQLGDLIGALTGPVSTDAVRKGWIESLMASRPALRWFVRP